MTDGVANWPPCSTCSVPEHCYKQRWCRVTGHDVNAPRVANASKSLDAQRVKLWREANRERYNARERLRMQKKRAERKHAPSV